MTQIRFCKSGLMSILALLGGCAGMSEGPAPVSLLTNDQLTPIRDAMQNECLAVARGAGADGTTSGETASRGPATVQGAAAGGKAAAPAPAQPAAAAPAPAQPAAAATASAQSREASQARRNDLVTAYMTAADIRYNAYERDLLAFSRQNDLGASIATQILSAVGAASGSQALSRATNITSGAVTGTQGAFAKSLLNQTVSVLQTHMRAQRAAQYAVIVERLGWTYERWNICMAFSDALAYEQAGTLNAALAAMAASAADNERHNVNDAHEAIQRVNYRASHLNNALTDYFGTADASLSTTRMGRAQAILTAAGLSVPAGTKPEVRIALILDGTSDAELRALALGVLQVETDQSFKAPIISALTERDGG